MATITTLLGTGNVGVDRTTINTNFANLNADKVEAVAGKGLSEEDFTTVKDTKLTGIEAGAEVNNISDTNATDLTDAGDSALHYHATDRARANHTGTQAASTITALPVEIGVACSDETTDLTTGTAKATFRMPYAMTLTGVRASVTTAPTGSVLTVDINEGGVSVLSTKLTIDATEKTSVTAAIPPVISDSALADDAEITIDIDGVGSTIAGTGLKIWMIGTRS